MSKRIALDGAYIGNKSDWKRRRALSVAHILKYTQIHKISKLLKNEDGVCHGSKDDIRE